MRNRRFMCATPLVRARGDAPDADAALGSGLMLAGRLHAGARAAGVTLRMLPARARARVPMRTSSARHG